ncbi:MAG: YbaK/EbsC family protein [Clostridia bacterium]|nr:YbaK/EbsC family protein [Clostridia bacterium]
MNTAIEYMNARGYGERVRHLNESSATVALAAKALSVTEGEIAKTLSFMLDGSPILIVMAGDVKTDNAKYRTEFGAKAKMLTPDEAVTLVGHAVGGVCPFGIKEGVKVYLDESLRRFTLVWAACGAIDEVIGLTIPELEALSGSLAWVDVSKPAAPTA